MDESLTVSEQGGVPGEARPNVLVIMSDQHAAAIIGSAGDPVADTPNLDALAARGVRFDNAYCQAPLCVPSRTAFLTGRQPHETRVWRNKDTLASDIPTFAHAAGAAGYETALIGRMHFNGLDQWHGFEQRLVGASSAPFPHLGSRLPPDLHEGARGNSREAVQLAGPGRTAYQAYDRDVTRATTEFLRGHAGPFERPFLAVVGLTLPHCPFVCTPEDWSRFEGRVGLPAREPIDKPDLHPAIRAWREQRNIIDLTDEDIRAARVGYYGLVAELDRNLGEILGELDRTGLGKNTVVVYTSDHGEMAGEHELWWKLTCYEDSVSVPLMVAGPGIARPGRVVAEVASLVDIAPTLLGMIGAEPLPSMAGADLGPLLRDEPIEWVNEAYAEVPPSRGVPPMRMVRSGGWKLVHYHGMRPQLFDLDSDPGELVDLGADPGHEPIRRQLTEKVLADWSAEGMLDTIREHDAANAVLTRWAQAVQPPVAPLWRPPPDANEFPLTS